MHYFSSIGWFQHIICDFYFFVIEENRPDQFIWKKLFGNQPKISQYQRTISQYWFQKSHILFWNQEFLDEADEILDDEKVTDGKNPVWRSGRWRMN
ncbi:unnamed protein product [Blepharisma stoltei]|uniref:Uncharacterized protein n=1 Tax=Blepharisma stoltei TaxID=1481888 RepID=A0AAU9K029_9CILI|nr:unnamed protein product [Blepharisma stoltei]